MPKFMKRSIIIEAEQFTDENKDCAYNFIMCNFYPSRDEKNNPTINIQTSNGIMTAKLGDWIIKGVGGEFYPCKPDIFEKTYQAVNVSQPTSLLPCPFCGAAVTMGKAGGAKTIYFQVECDCGAVAGSAYTTEDSAVKNWNRRV